MSEDKNPEMVQHFDELKTILPELYISNEPLPESIADKLFGLLKNSLGVMEAVYLQSPENFSTARHDVYAIIIQELRNMGLNYRGNEEILGSTAGQLIMQGKKPMEKAGLPKVSKLEKEAG